MSDDWVNAKTLQVIGEYSMMHDLITLDGVAYVCNERYKPYYEENAARLERERIIESLRAYAGDESLISIEVAIALINNVEGQ